MCGTKIDVRLCEPTFSKIKLVLTLITKKSRNRQKVKFGLEFITVHFIYESFSVFRLYSSIERSRAKETTITVKFRVLLKGRSQLSKGLLR